MGSHMDDEIFILMHLLDLRAQGHEVHFLWITSAIRKNGTEPRRHENENLMTFLQVEAKYRHDLEFVDGKMYIQIKKVYKQLNSLIIEINPRTIFVNAFEGGNIDHDVTNYILHMVNEMHNHKYKVYEYHLYNNYSSNLKSISFKFGDFPEPNADSITRTLSSAETELKKQCFRFYKSQYWVSMFYIVIFNARNNTFFSEKFRPLPNHNYFQKPKGGVAYEKYQSSTYDDFVHSIKSLAMDLLPDKKVRAENIEEFEHRIEDYRRWLQNYILNVLKPNGH